MNIPKPLVWALLLVWVALPTLQLFAQPSSATSRVSFRILPFQTLSIGGGRGRTAVSTVHVPQPQLSDLERGYIEQRNAVTLQIQSNIPWKVKVRTDQPDMGRSFDGTYVKPVSDFQVRAEGGRYLTLSPTDQVLLQGQVGQYTFGVDYRTLFDPKTFRNGNYSLDVIYTIVSR